ncbi:hypothetical protein Tco_1150170 [Tanacetum coccineum]
MDTSFSSKEIGRCQGKQQMINVVEMKMLCDYILILPMYLVNTVRFGDAWSEALRVQIAGYTNVLMCDYMGICYEKMLFVYVLDVVNDDGWDRRGSMECY